MENLKNAIRAFDVQKKEGRKRKRFEMLFYEIGEKTEEKAVEKILTLSIRKDVKDEILRRIREKFQTKDKPYMHYYSRIISNNFERCKNEGDEMKVLSSSNNILKSISDSRISDRIIDEVAECLSIDMNLLRRSIVSNAPFWVKSNKSNQSFKQYVDKKKSFADAANAQISSLCDYFGLNYIKRHKEDIGKYPFVVGAYIPEYDAIIDITNENNAKTSDMYREIVWRKEQLKSRFKICVFLDPKEAFKKTIALDKVNQALGLGYKAMDLID